MDKLSLLCQTDVLYVVTKSLSGAEPTYRMSLRKSFFKYSRKNISRPHASKTLNPPPCGRQFWANTCIKKKKIPTVMHRIFKKLRRYFLIPLGIQESFREIVARRKRVMFVAFDCFKCTVTWITFAYF